MATTSALGLKLTSTSEWATEKYEDFILELAGDSLDSNMSIIDTVVGEIQNAIRTLETSLSTI